MRSKNIVIMTIILLSVTICAFAEEILTNESVIKMVKLGIADDIIIAKINAGKGSYDTSPEALSKLQKMGVSTKIITAMIETKSDPSKAVSAFAAKIPEGKFLLKKEDGYQKILPVKVTSEFSHRKAWIPFRVSSSLETFIFIAGKGSNIKVTNAHPVFYTRIEPSKIMLVKLGFHRNKEKRYVVFSGSHTDREIQLVVEAEGDIYRITPKDELEAGEYAFLASIKAPFTGVAMGLPDIEEAYDFGVNVNSSKESNDQ
ncbi:MAG: hypothetical protein AB1632_01690 [Nitrospirota bacterium]